MKRTLVNYSNEWRRDGDTMDTSSRDSEGDGRGGGGDGSLATAMNIQ